MGTKVHRNSYFPHTMRDLNDEIDNSNWPMCYGDNAITNAKYCNGFITETTRDTDPNYDKDVLKQRILEHEAIFKGQLYELHRLYRIQREMMEEAKKKELHRLQVSTEQPSSSSSSLLFNSGYVRTSPLSCTREYNARSARFPFQNGSALKECDALDSRPSKVRKKLFDLQLPPEKNSGIEEEIVDLNQPIRIGVEEGAMSMDFQGHASVNRDVKGANGLEKSTARCSVGVNGESIYIRDGFSIKSGVGHNFNEERVPHIYEAGSSKSNFIMQAMLNPSLDQNRAQSNNGHLEHFESSRTSTGSYPFFNSSCFPKTPWTCSSSSHVMSSGALNQKRAPFDSSLNSIATMDRSFPPSAQSQVPSGGNWLVNASSGLASATREPQSYLNHNVRKREIYIDLNEADEENMTRDDHSALPWLKHKTAPKEEAANASNDGEVGTKKEIVEAETPKKILGIPIFDAVTRTNSESDGIHKERKKWLIDINLECEPDDDDNVAAEEPALEKENRSKFLIDLNTCVIDSEDLSLPSSESKTRHAKRVLEIDLEAPPLQESEDDDTRENVADDSSLKLLVNKVEPIHDEALRNAAETIFAISSFHPQEAQSETSLPDPLVWFVDTVSSLAEDDKSPENELPSSEEIDDFEATTLQLQDMKEEEGYMARPFVPEIRELNETRTSNLSITRSRRGHSRRGRQRKDFQRDTLPGLATLSRHEVTEDIQTFGGLMRATGHHWNSGLTRRNGGTRGRRRAVSETLSNVVQSRACAAHVVQKLGDVEAVLEDRSLTGWGKTTRRPRRQRCQAGNNPPMAVLT